MIDLGKIESAQKIMVVLQLFFALWAFILIKPFFEAIFIGFIIAIVFYPLYVKLNKLIGNKTISSLLTILTIFLVFIFISTVFISSLISEFTNILNSAPENIAKLVDRIETITSGRFSITDISYGVISGRHIRQQATELILRNKAQIISYFTSFLGVIGGLLPKLIVIFYLIFYIFIEDKTIFEVVKKIIPLSEKNKKEFMKDLSKNIKGIIIGQGFTSFCSGLAGGLGFYIFGFHGALFWGFVMMIFAFLPMIGTNMIWLPAGFISLIMGDYFSGVGILIWGFTVMTFVDNIFTPQIISRYMKAHPVAVLLGVFGGVSYYGIIGVFLGPLVFVTLGILLKYYEKDYNRYKRD